MFSVIIVKAFWHHDDFLRQVASQLWSYS
jgi:hypothetical protein